MMRLRVLLARLWALLSRLRAPLLRSSARLLSLRALSVCLLALWMHQWVLGMRLQARRRHLARPRGAVEALSGAMDVMGRVDRRRVAVG